jgi:hypothetical protein
MDFPSLRVRMADEAANSTLIADTARRQVTYSPYAVRPMFACRQGSATV